MPRKIGPKAKPFSELGRMQQRRVTQEAFNSVKDLAAKRETDVVNMAGYMLKRAAYTTDKGLGEVGRKVEKGEEIAALRKLDKEHCLWMLTFGEDMGKFQLR